MSSTDELDGRSEAPPRSGTNRKSPSLDEVYHIFGNRRRRYTLHYLKQVDGKVDFGTMAEQIAAWEQEKPRLEVTSDERKYVYSALQQRHLPKMDDIGLVEFNKRDASVEPTSALAEIDIYAEVVEKDNIPWGMYFPALSAVYLVLLALFGLDVAPLMILSDFEWAVVFVSSFLVSSFIFLYDTKRMKLGRRDVPPEVGQQ